MLDLQMLDITRDPIEIAPTAHYSMGGVRVRPEDHGTDIAGLYAIGEASSGTHGANRLGGNSLAELLVYGRIVGQAAAEYSRRLPAELRSTGAVVEARGEVDTLLAGRGYDNVRSMQRALRNLMSEHGGVIRDDEGLRTGLVKLDEVEARMPNLAVHPDIAGFDDLAHAFDLKGSMLAARATLESAFARTETRGAHNRCDYPALDPALKVNMVWSLTGGLTQEPVADTPTEIARLIPSVENTVVGKLVE
ncbi:hypothetical protein GCM10027414_21470 [Humibacter ginsengiterrae]